MLDPKKEISFPASVIEFFKGEIGIPHGGLPKELQKKVLGEAKPLTKRPGEVLESVDLDKEAKNLEDEIGMKINQTHLASYLMYQKFLKIMWITLRSLVIHQFFQQNYFLWSSTR